LFACIFGLIFLFVALNNASQPAPGMSNHKKFIVVRASSWDEARNLAGYMILWHFRGQADAQWELATSIERATRPPANRMFLGTIEGNFIYEFRRRAHHYLASPPGDKALLEWLALLQHYGCPTRLLDFTHSFYVAAFFAVERATGDAAVWAINQKKLNVAGDAIVKRRSSSSGDLGIYDWNRRNIEVAESHIGTEKQMNLVVDVEPERLNERVSIQRGNFLFPCNIGASFMDNLFTGIP
jgi:hypothetical protein